MSDGDRYEAFIRITDSDDDQYLYLVEHWFFHRPDAETLRGLLEEARHTFELLYPDVQADDFSVEVRRLRPQDTGPDQGATAAAGIV